MPAPALTVLGDSFAEGRGDPGPDGSFVGWVPRTAAALGIPRGRVLNLGSYGATTQTVVDSQLAVALANRSSLVGVTVGGNDLVSDYDRDRFESNLDRIFTALAVPGTTVFTMTFPDIPAMLPIPPNIRDVLRPRFSDANDHVHKLVAGRVLCLDLASVSGITDPALWNPDGMHPSPAGYRAVADRVIDMIKTAWASRAPHG
ncbi:MULTISPECIES: SGNH/GDSL hydrolase family protein [unclassified Frankia]|uniref:SGNH/GDSL hydrolase family protein n=1 Tax=unclassified Frankia TaxID=2632575 RepID=UPI001EF4D436|nr:MULTISPECIES: SGNH/GDSL hydrolase family protein [unclassified Frankia]